MPVPVVKNCCLRLEKRLTKVTFHMFCMQHNGGTQEYSGYAILPAHTEVCCHHFGYML